MDSVSAAVVSRHGSLIKGELAKNCAIEKHYIDLGLDIDIS